MEVDLKKVKLSEIRPNPDNPRTIRKDKMDKLKKSLKDFPEMLNLREIVVDENMIILAGNMRYYAMKENGETEAIVKIANDLTDDQKREFIAKDNISFGEFDMDLLANDWSDLPLSDWGFDLPDDWFSDEPGEIAGDDAPEDNYAEQYGVIVICDNEAHQEETFNKLTEQGMTCRVVNT